MSSGILRCTTGALGRPPLGIAGPAGAMNTIVTTPGSRGPAPDAGQTIARLVETARNVSRPDLIVDQLCTRLVEGGVPLDRASILVRTLHPSVVGRRFTWRAGGGVEVEEAGYELLTSPELKASPYGVVIESGKPMRRRLAGSDAPLDSAMLERLRRDGVTDYLAQPLRFSNGDVHFVSWTTRRAGGFANDHIAQLERIEVPLALVTEIVWLRRTAANLLNLYVGRDAGERILRGQIRRGHTETIHAAIWLSDLKGFTELSDSLPGDRLIALLNEYFDALVAPIEAEGGEVLKFMGDGLLAIFPLRPDRPAARVSAAARDAVGRLATRNAQRKTAGEPVLATRISLHIGHVDYGNIGSQRRLDFTVIGPAVNLAARLDRVAATLGRARQKPRPRAGSAKPKKGRARA